MAKGIKAQAKEDVEGSPDAPKIGTGTLPDSDDFYIQEFLPLGVFVFDHTLLKKGGLPMNQIVEFYGPEGSCKSYMAIRAAAMAQRQYPGKKVVWLDAENRFDPEWWVRGGVDLSPERWRLYRANDFETGVPKIIKALATGEVSLIVVDSIGNMNSVNALDASSFGTNAKGEQKSVQPGVQAKAITRLVQSVNYYQNRDIGTMFLVINQMRQKIGVTYGSDEDRPGGNALKHDVSCRLKFGKHDFENLVEDGEIVAFRVHCRVDKNSKVGTPIVKATTDANHPYVYIDNGIEKGMVVNLYNLAVQAKVVKVAGSWISYGDFKVQGPARFIARMLAEPEFTAQIQKELDAEPNKETAEAPRRIVAERNAPPKYISLDDDD